MIGHLVDSENHLGRSLIIDLNAAAPHNFRQVDHRSIEYIIFKNVKYSLGKRTGEAPEQLPIKQSHDVRKWAPANLEVNNWFSSISYYKIKEIVDKDTVMVCNCQEPSKVLSMSRDILLKEMYSAQIHEKTEKISRSNLVELMMNAKETVMTIEFRRKVQEDWIRSQLKSKITKQSDLENAKFTSTLAKELVSGESMSMTCFITKSENKLGRSCVIDLSKKPGFNYRLVDHRTVDSVILKNVKYVV